MDTRYTVVKLHPVQYNILRLMIEEGFKNCNATYKKYIEVYPKVSQTNFRDHWHRLIKDSYILFEKKYVVPMPKTKYVFYKKDYKVNPYHRRGLIENGYAKDPDRK